MRVDLIQKNGMNETIFIEGSEKLNICESLEFLRDLSNEMKTQQTDYQAAPRFWVVAENKREWGIATGYEDGEVICSCDGETYETIDEFIKFALENGYLDEDKYNSDYDYSIYEILELVDDCDFWSCGYRDNYNSIVPNTFFLTKRECEDHIKANSYHYNEPHTYCMTAWRSPQVEKLFNILENTDWNSLILQNTNLGGTHE